MTKEQLLCEKHFLACLTVMQQLTEKGLLTAEEFEHAKRILLQKYKPAVSALML